MPFPLTWLPWPVSVFPWPKGGVALSVESDGLPRGSGAIIDRRELDAGHWQFAGNHSHVPCLPFQQLLLYPPDIMLLYPSDDCFFTLPTVASLPFRHHASLPFWRLLLYPFDSCFFTLPTATSLSFQHLLLYVSDGCFFTLSNSYFFTLPTVSTPLFSFGFLPFRQLPPNCSLFLLGFYPADSCFPSVHSFCWIFTLPTTASLPFQQLLLHCSLVLGFYPPDSCFPTVYSSAWVFTLPTAASPILFNSSRWVFTIPKLLLCCVHSSPQQWKLIIPITFSFCFV